MIGPIVDLSTFLGGREQVSMVLVPWELMSKVSEYYMLPAITFQIREP